MANFIKNRLNKDNLWNLVFFIGITVIVGISELLAKNISAGLVLPLTIPSFIISTYCFTKIAKLKQSDKHFKQSNPIFGQTLIFLSIMVVTFIVFPFFLLDGKIFMELLISNIVAWFLIIPTLYCISSNFPISVYFHKNAWVDFDRNNSSGQSVGKNHSKSILSLDRLRNDPINSWHNTNIYRRK